MIVFEYGNRNLDADRLWDSLSCDGVFLGCGLCPT